MKKTDYIKNLTPTQLSNIANYYITKQFTGPPFPLVAKIELTRKCNAQCQMCKLPSLPQYPDITLEQFKNILKQLPKTPIIAPHGFGEPYSHPQIQLYLDAIKIAGKQIALVTNGSKLNILNISNLLNLKPLRITISIDAAEKEPYETIRKNLSWSTLAENLHFLNLIKTNRKLNTEIEYYCTLGKYNQNQIKPLMQLAEKHHANKLSFVPLDTHEIGTAKEENQCDTTQVKEEISLYKPYHNNITINQYFDKPRKCTVPFNEIYIACNGNVYPCCKTLTWNMGNAFKEPLKDIWQNTLYRQFRTRYRANQIQECNKCRGTPPNLNELIETGQID